MKPERALLVDRLGHSMGLTRLAFAAVVGVPLTALLLLAAYADGVFQNPGPWGLWRMALEPAIVVYVLATYPTLYRRWGLAMESLRPLSARPELIDQQRNFDRGGEWAALLLGAAFGVWAHLSQAAHGKWLAAYGLAAAMVMFALLALVVRDGLIRGYRLKRIVSGGLQLDIFDRKALTPLARWGLSASLTFVGGTCLSLIFQSYQTLNTLQSMVIYSILTAVSVTLFFSSTWSIHGALVAAQERELAAVHRHWVRARSALLQQLASDEHDKVAGLYDPIVVLGAYEKQVRSTSTWPFDAKIGRDLGASLAAPIVLYGLRIAFGVLAGR